ncbi:MAG: hypothetical protein ACRD0K_01995 [Egibacteraceae bacterium]
MSVPDPGPKPGLFEFPFAQGRAAINAIDDAVVDLRGLVGQHEAAAAYARVGFEGQVREQFDQIFNESMGAWEGKTAILEGQRDELEAALAEAQRRLQASEDAIAEWQQRHNAFLSDRAGE